MQNEEISEKGYVKAKQCLECPLCKRVREKQKGLIFFVRQETRIRPLPRLQVL